MYNLVQKEKDIDAVLNECAEQEDKGGSRFPGMTYEQGVRAGIDWLIGNVPEPPLE